MNFCLTALFDTSTVAPSPVQGEESPDRPALSVSPDIPRSHTDNPNKLMIKVVRERTENIESLLRRFKRKCNREGLSRDIKRKAFYEKPTEKRRRKMRERERAIRKAEAAKAKAATKRKRKPPARK